MKKLSKLIALAVSLIVVSFSGCSNLVDDATIDSGNVRTGAKTVTLTATADSDIVTFGDGSGRMIMPGQLNATTGYTFYLCGENETTGSDLTPDTVTLKATGSSTTKGTVTLNLDIARYNLRLYAVESVNDSIITSSKTETNIKKYAVLWASARADFTYGDAVNFYLTPYGLSEGGGYALAVYLDGWTLPSGYTSKVRITNLDDPTTDVANTTPYETALTNDVLDLDHVNVEQDHDKKVAPNTYNFIVEFENSALGVTYYYSDRIVILSNQTTKKVIPVPNVIGAKPDAPSDLGISYVDAPNVTQDFYELVFNWTDKSYNEANFQLTLIDITNTTATDIPAALATLKTANGGSGADETATAAIKAAWEVIVKNDSNHKQIETEYTYGKQVTKTVYATSDYSTEQLGDFDGNVSAGYVAGSFRMNHTAATIRVQLGHRYIARLAAVNAAGVSDYIYPDIVGTTVDTAADYIRYATGETVAAASQKKFGANAALINRFRITYYLDGGSFYEADTLTNGGLPARKDTTKVTSNVPGLQKSGDSVVIYETQAAASTNQVSILNGLYSQTTDTTPKNIILYDTNSRRWADWLYGSTTGDVYTTNYVTYPAADEDYSVAGVPYMEWTSTGKSATVVGFSNITLYASYSSASWELDHSADFNIKDDWVALYHATAATGSPDPVWGPTTATDSKSKIDGAWSYQYSTSAGEPSDAGDRTNAAHIFVLLLNDKVKNIQNGAAIEYDTESSYVEIFRTNGNISKGKCEFGSTPKSVNTKITSIAANADDYNFSYAEIDLGELAADKYDLVIHAYANTTQKEYTHTITIDVGK